MIFARVLFLFGSVLALFGIWRLIGPFIYERVGSNPGQAVIFLVAGVIMLWAGYQLERRNKDGSPYHE